MYSADPSRAPTVSLEAGLASILVQWEELQAGDRNGVIIMYNMYVREKGSDVPGNVTKGISGTLNEFLIQSKYGFRSSLKSTE